MILNNVNYETKTEVHKLIKNILHKYQIDDVVNAEDKTILSDLLGYHQNFPQKRGCGIADFLIYINSYNRRGFKLIRLDGSSTDFSYMKCITHQSLASKVKECCREAVSLDIRNFKTNQFSDKKEMICPYSKEVVTQGNCHVHHQFPSFLEIFDEWYNSKTITESDISKSVDNSEARKFVNEDLKKDFREFHYRIANLQIVSIKANLSLLK